MAIKLNDKQLERYARHIVLPEIGLKGQEKLLSSSVLVLGAGGLGSSVLTYLASSGIGTIGIVDYDDVALSNLHRQTIYNTDDLNQSKVISVKEKIKKINPEIKVLTYNEKLDKVNIKKIFSKFEIIIDGLDNFSDKFLVNDFSVLLNKKLIHAGVIGYEGQVLTVFPKESACLRCFFSGDEPSDFNQSCKEVGVLAPCVGVLGTLQVIEAIKIILEIGKPLTNRVLKYNALDSIFYEFKVQGRNKNCPICS